METAALRNRDAGARDEQLQAAKTLRARQRVAEALTMLARLEAQHPRFSRLFQERGQCYIGLGDAEAALAALCEAVRLNPALPASWDMLEQLYRMRGDKAQADRAAQHLAALKALPPEVVVASSLFADGDLEPAEAVMRHYLRAAGGNAGAQHLLARILMARAAFDEAEPLLAAVLDAAPDDHAARLDYAMALLQQQKHVKARRQAEILLAHAPDHRDYLKAYGAACIGLGDHEPVVDLYDRLLAEQDLADAEIAELRLFRANALKITGRPEEAIADYRAALAARPDQAVAWFSLANLKTWHGSDAEMARMQAAEARPDTQIMDRVYLNFALGKALEDRGDEDRGDEDRGDEDRGDYAAAWACYARGNGLRHTLSRYRPEVAEACAARLQQVFTAKAFAERAGWGVADAAPIFIVGLPRSGSTLIEQILASHPAVEGTQELTEIGRYAGEICGLDADGGLPREPQAMLRLTKAEARGLGERFLTETRAYRRLGRPFFIDKMPNNVWHIGLIHLILPNAKIIDVRREPMACGFSNFKQLFGARHQEFSYSLDHIGRYYRSYLGLMRHWDAVLPGRVLRLHYEDVVEHTEDSVRRLLAHCGLLFDAACLRFYETKRSVRTPSSEQVRQPISREGLEQWRNFAAWLDDLRAALGDAVTGYRD